MKKLGSIFFISAAWLGIAFSASCLPAGDPLQSVKTDMNAGNPLNDAFQKAKQKTLESVIGLMLNPTDPGKMAQFAEANRRMHDAARELAVNRNKVINGVITTYGLNVPPGQVISYDAYCAGEGVWGSCSLECTITIHEAAFHSNPIPGDGTYGGSPAWVAAIIKHELEHKKQIDPGPPPDWNNSLAVGEYEAWQAAKNCAQSSKLPDADLKAIIAEKDYWWGQMTASERIGQLIKSIGEWWEKFITSLPDRIFSIGFSVKNYGDTPEQVTCLITNQRNWLIEPNTVMVTLLPGQELDIPVTVHVPDTADLNSKNELFVETVTPEGLTRDFMFITVKPTITVTPGENLLAHRGETVPISFLAGNDIGAPPDMFRIELSSSLGWPIFPSYYEAYLGPGEGFTFMSMMNVPPGLPYWTTDLVYCRATSLSDPQQTDEKWISVQISENDVCALMIESPLGEHPKGSAVMPSAWIYNDGMAESFFDVFTEVSFPLPHKDSLTGLYLPPGHDMLFYFPPVPLNEEGDFPVTFYTRSPDDANRSNDTIRSMFTVAMPEHLYLQNQIVPVGFHYCFEASKTIMTGGFETFFIVEPEAGAILVAGEKVMMEPYTHFLNGSQVHAYIDPTGMYCPPMKKPYDDILSESESAHPDGASPPEDELFRIYPNPTPGRFTLEVNDPSFSSPIMVEVFSTIGERVTSSEFQGAKRYTLDLSGRQPGLYLIKVIIGNRIRTAKIIRQ